MLHKDQVNQINIYNVSFGEKQELYKIDALINSVQIVMEIDRGALISVTNHDTYFELSCKSKI